MADRKSMDELVIFDGDDTLWASQELYEEAKNAIKEVLEGAGFNGEAWAARLEPIDVARVTLLGWDTTRFPGSCVIAYQELASESGADADAELMTRIFGLATTVFTGHARLIDGAEVVLRRLGKSFRLALLTQGDASVQRRRIEASDLAPFFDSIDIVDMKSESSFISVVEHHHARTAKTWSIGNSLRSDVLPALRAGLNAIWLHGRGWDYDIAHEVHTGQEYHRAGSLFEAEAILVRANMAIPAGWD